MSSIERFRSSAVVGAIASLVVACSGNIGTPETGDEKLPEVGTSQEALHRPIDPAKEMVITDFSVIESPTETTFDADHPSGTHRNGAWTIGRALHNMLPKHQRDSREAASKLAFDWLHQWEADQAPNSAVTVSHARSRIRDEVITPWKTASGCVGDDASCVLDMGKAPFRLIAIVYRPDLRVLSTPSKRGIGGEGRFVFQLVNPTSGNATKFTTIFEYSLPIENNAEVLWWAYRWHTLGAIPYGPLYNAFLRNITNDFSGPDQDRTRPNGNAIDQVRTNDVRTVFVPGSVPPVTNLGKLWEVREFHLHTEGLIQAPMAQEPSRDFDVLQRGTAAAQILGTGTRSAELAAWLGANASAVLAGTHTVPAAWLANSSYISGSAALGTSVPAWGMNASGVRQFPGVAEDVRHNFALNTCAGCHRQETGRPLFQADGVTPVIDASIPGGTTQKLQATPFLMLTDRSAFDPTDTSDQPFIPAVSATPTHQELHQTVITDFLQAQIVAGGFRNNDFVTLLNTPIWSLVQPHHRRDCSHPMDSDI
ncbi:MAG: hypothetical protein ACXWP4_12055 [Polyangiales bacterium]